MAEIIDSRRVQNERFRRLYDRAHALGSAGTLEGEEAAAPIYAEAGRALRQLVTAAVDEILADGQPRSAKATRHLKGIKRWCERRAP